MLLHDTAGLRKKARVAGETLEEMSVASTLDAIRFADCVIVMIDATQPFEKQDLTIADLIAREGRAIVFAVNKWDLVENKQGAISTIARKAGPAAAAGGGRGAGGDLGPDRRRAGPAGAGRHRRRQGLEQPRAHRGAQPFPGRRAAAPCPAGDPRPAGAHPLHDPGQERGRPPSPCSATSSTPCPRPIMRYLQNGLRENFGLKGTPLRLVMRNTKNPYDPRKR